jgi:hypothetical protein
VQCNCHRRNFWQAVHYGNHKSTDMEPAKTRKSVIKDCRRGYALSISQLLLPYISHAHGTPLGMVDLDKPYKTPRPVFDSIFRATKASYAINDWTNKHNEPPVHFATSFQKLLTWVWNMRISYPCLEIYPIDNDMTSGFRHCKYNPNLVSMHCYLVYGILLMATGQTFGDTGSPGNFEAIPLARQQMATHLWGIRNVISFAKKYTPNFTIAPPPDTATIESFILANKDSKNPGVFHPDGSRLPPTYDHHVDDLMSADIADLLPRTISASILSLYQVLGFPTKHQVHPRSTLP